MLLESFTTCVCGSSKYSSFEFALSLIFFFLFFKSHFLWKLCPTLGFLCTSISTLLHSADYVTGVDMT